MYLLEQLSRDDTLVYKGTEHPSLYIRIVSAVTDKLVLLNDFMI